MASTPSIALRLAMTYGDVTRRVDLQIAGSRGVVVEDGRETPFETARLWPVVRDLLPPLEPLRTDPAGRRSPTSDERPGPGWVEECRAVVALAIVAAPEGPETESPELVLRTWVATDDELWSATPRPDGSTDVRLARPGDLAELLVWDVTGALEALVQWLAS